MRVLYSAKVFPTEKTKGLLVTRFDFEISSMLETKSTELRLEKVTRSRLKAFLKKKPI